MGRPRSYDQRRVVLDAERVFWTRGYNETSIDEIEGATGLSRSSLYHAFGTKDGLFDASLAAYVAGVTDALLGPVEAPGASRAQICEFFTTLASRFGRRGGQRGCLMVNTIAERAGRDPRFTAEASAFLGRLESAFSNALGRGAATKTREAELATDRARMLAACTLGVWIAVRADPGAATAMCDAIAAQVRGWR